MRELVLILTYLLKKSHLKSRIQKLKIELILHLLTFLLHHLSLIWEKLRLNPPPLDRTKFIYHIQYPNLDIKFASHLKQRIDVILHNVDSLYFRKYFYKRFWNLLIRDVLDGWIYRRDTITTIWLISCLRMKRLFWRDCTHLVANNLLILHNTLKSLIYF
jgi:hypothetical protein